MLLEAPPSSQASRTGTELHTLRKRQSFTFGDNRLQPAVPADQPQTDTQLPLQPVTASAAASGTAAGLSAAPEQAAAQDVAGKDKSSKPHVAKLKVPSLAGGKVRPPVSVAAPAAAGRAAPQIGQPSVSAHTSPSAVSSTRAAAGSSQPALSKGEAAARAPAAMSPQAARQTAGRSPKPATPRKPGWQH